MDHYNTTPEQVQQAAAELGQDARLTHALLERGHTVEQIREMKPGDRFKEYCEWEGLLGHSDLLLRIAASAGVRMADGMADCGREPYHA